MTTYWAAVQRGGMVEQAKGGPASTMVPVTDQSEVGNARRTATALGERAGLDETERGTLAIVVTELATNLALHARSGMLVLRALGTPAAGGVEVLALDKGPGIADLSRAMTDGFSTAGTAGKGLGAIRRMASEFDLVSNASTGTALLARVWSASGLRARRQEARTEGVICMPVEGEQACGDGWMVRHDASRTLAVVVDGLGHGVEAAKAADAALRVLGVHSDAPPSQLVTLAHGALRATRGAALAIAEVLPGQGIVRFAGIGNISAAVTTADGVKSMASFNGTVGHVLHKVQDFTYPWSAGACLLMHSDGLMTRWRLESYPGLATRHPALLAGVLFRDFVRGRDDVTVLAVRPKSLQD